MERDIEKDLIEIECAIKSQKEKDNIFTMSVLQRCYKLVSQLKEYEDLEEQNRLLKLPCAVGDTVYYRYDGIKIAPMHVEKIIIAKYGVNLLLAYCGNDEKLEYWTIDIESTAINCGIVFLTREEAEAALKELERGKGE